MSQDILNAKDEEYRKMAQTLVRVLDERDTLKRENEELKNCIERNELASAVLQHQQLLNYSRSYILDSKEEKAK